MCVEKEGSGIWPSSPWFGSGFPGSLCSQYAAFYVILILFWQHFVCKEDQIICFVYITCQVITEGVLILKLFLWIQGYEYVPVIKCH